MTPKRKLRHDANVKTFADYVYEFLISVGGSALTTEIRAGLTQFHRESLAKGLRNLRKSGMVTTERAKIKGLPSATLRVVVV